MTKRPLGKTSGLLKKEVKAESKKKREI